MNWRKIRIQLKSWSNKNWHETIICNLNKVIQIIYNTKKKKKTKGIQVHLKVTWKYLWKIKKTTAKVWYLKEIE